MKACLKSVAADVRRRSCAGHSERTIRLLTSPATKAQVFKPALRKSILSPAFTLLELLTVISIVSVLAGLLLPSLCRGKPQASRVVCLNNVYQLGLTWRLYADDHHGQSVANG